MRKSEIDQLLKSFQELKILVIGDVMIDSYYWGKVNRISPEAPVPIVSVNKKEYRLGGAANVALNIQALGAEPIMCSVIGEDEESKIFYDLLKKQKLSDKGIMKSSSRITTVKTRIIGNHHQMLRIDSETEAPLSENETKQLFSRVKTLLDAHKIDVILFQDYDKGVITPPLIKAVVELAKEKGIPTAVDPKKKNFLAFKGVTLFKPNLKELKEGLKLDMEGFDLRKVIEAVDMLNKELGNEITFITLSENGVFIKKSSEQHHLSAHLRDITDVSGAGDTVISVAALCLALDQPIRNIAALSNLAGGLVCERVGVVPIDKDQLQAEAHQLIALD